MVRKNMQRAEDVVNDNVQTSLNHLFQVLVVSFVFLNLNHHITSFPTDIIRKRGSKIYKTGNVIDSTLDGGNKCQKMHN